MHGPFGAYCLTYLQVLIRPFAPKNDTALQSSIVIESLNSGCL